MGMDLLVEITIPGILVNFFLWCNRIFKMKI